MSSILVLDAAAVDYETFREACLKPNRPALIRNAGQHFRLVDAPSTLKETTELPDVTPFKEILSRRGLEALFGDLDKKECPVYHCRNAEDAADTAEGASDDGPMVVGTASLSAILQSWCVTGSLHTTAPTYQQQRQQQHSPRRMYLMNWHFQQEVEGGGERTAAPQSAQSPRSTPSALYAIPSFLGLDLMHAYHLHCQAHQHTQPKSGKAAGGDVADVVRPFGNGTLDYRFVYMGVEGTWTPFHHDVFGSFSWSLNVGGKKLWYFFDAASQAAMHDALPVGRPLPCDMRVISGAKLDAVVQAPGDLMFVPSGWYHQVHNVEGAPYSCSTDDEGDGSTSSSANTAGGEAAVNVATAQVVASVNHNWMSFEQLPRMVGLLRSEVDALLRMVGDDTRVLFNDDNEWVSMVDQMLWGSGSWNVSIVDGFLRFCDALLRDPESWLIAWLSVNNGRGCPATEEARVDSVQQKLRLCCLGGPLFEHSSAGAVERVVAEWMLCVDEGRRVLEECKQAILAKPAA